jgi:hypothetical protein
MVAILVCFVYYVGFFFLHKDMSGYSWIPITSGLPMIPTVMSMTAGVLTSMIFIGTYDQGLYRSTQTVAIHEVSSLSKGNSLTYCYPNPFETSTTFEFSVPDKSFVYISVHDQSGKLIKTLVSNFYNKGSYKITWEPEELDAGVYYFQMSSGTYKSTGKFVFLGK